MSKAMLMVLLAMSGSAAADWVALGSSNNQTLYADPATISRSGDTVKMWDMYDLKAAQSYDASGGRYLSRKNQSEFDCKDERVRTVSFTLHAGHMGNGGVVFSSAGAPANWVSIVPGSVDEDNWKVACGKQIPASK